MSIFTNVQKIKLNQIAIPGQEGGFDSNIFGIVDIDHNIIYRTLPENKHFVTNQETVAFFEEAATNLNIPLHSIDGKLMYKGAQMCKEYSAPIDETYSFRFYLYNAYNKGNGHTLITLLVADIPDTGHVRTAFFTLPEALSEIVLGESNLENTQNLLAKVKEAAQKEVQFLEWAKNEALHRDINLPETFNPLYNTMKQPVKHNIHWRLRSMENRTIYNCLATIGAFIENRRMISSSVSNPLYNAIRTQTRKFIATSINFRANELLTLTEGYTYEEPETINPDEQNSTSNGITDTTDADAGDTPTLSRTIPTTGTTYDLAG